MKMWHEGQPYVLATLALALTIFFCHFTSGQHASQPSQVAAKFNSTSSSIGMPSSSPKYPDDIITNSSIVGAPEDMTNKDIITNSSLVGAPEDITNNDLILLPPGDDKTRSLDETFSQTNQSQKLG